MLVINAHVRGSDGPSPLDGFRIGGSGLGLKDYLDYQAEGIDEIAHPTSLLGVDLISRGEASVMPDLVSSNRMKELIDAARERYTLVLLEAPAAIEFVDAARLVRWRDGALFIVASGARAPRVKKALAMITIEEIAVAGVILMGADERLAES